MVMMRRVSIGMVVASALLIAAHFLRVGLYPLVVLSVAFPLLLTTRNPWVTRLVQILLGLAGAEWIRTLLALVAERRAIGQPWAAAAIILGVVAAFTMASALVIRPRDLLPAPSPERQHRRHA